MALTEHIARSIVKKRRDELSELPQEERRAVVGNIVQKLSERSEDDLISFVSSRDKTVSPEVTSEINRLSSINPKLLDEADRNVINNKLKDAEHLANLNQLGVETGQPLPTGDIELGFGDDPVESLTNVLSEHFKQPVTVFKRGEDILYIDPESQAVKRAEPSFFGSVGKGLTPAGDIAGTVGGGVVGGFFGKSPQAALAGETIGSGLGTSSAEFLRLSIGKAFGVHDLSLGEMLSKSGLEGAKASAATAITGGIIATGKGLKNFFKGNVFTKDEALKHGFNTEQADLIMDEVNKILKGKAKVKGTLFTRTGDVVTGAKEAEIRKNIRHAADFAERDISDQKALLEAVDIITKPKTVSGGQAVQEVFEKQVGKRVSQARSIVSKNVDNLQSQLDQIGKVRKELVGEPTRKILLKKSKATNDAVDDVWDEVRKIGGFKESTKSFGIAVPTGKETKRIRKIMDRRAKTTTTKISSKSTSNIFGKKGKPADLADYNREISDLKAEIRAAKNNKQFGTPQVSDMEDVVTAMEADRRLSLIKSGREGLLEKIEQAELATAQFHDTFNRSVVGDLTAKNEKGIFKIKSKEFVDKTLKGSGDEADQLLQVIGDSPTLVRQWKEGIADAYKRVAFRDNKFNKFQSDKFLESNSDVLSRFFTKGELTAFKKTGKLAERVKKQSAQLDRIVKEANAKFGKGKLKSLDPDNLVKFVTNESGNFVTPAGRGVQTATNKIRFVKNATRDHPEAWRKFTEEFSTQLRKDIVDPDKGVNPERLKDWIDNKSGIIQEIMGEEYLKNLKSIKKVAVLLNKKPAGLSGDEGRAGVIQLVRSGAAPPLTRRGRAFTAVVIFDSKRAHAKIAEALLNPSSMKKVAELAEHNTITREAAELAVSLGFIVPE